MKEQTACIFNIQKFSLHDGPGIRTVVFFKGCPLKCKWCSNPESQSGNIELTWNEKTCVMCQKCVNSCKNGAITLKDNLIHIDSAECTLCQTCVNVCPTNSIANEGKLTDVESVVFEVLKDKDFYEESSGGVTLSGGEVLAQKDFAVELLKELKNHGIHTAAETTGYADIDVFKEFIKNIDLLLFDVKHYDEEVHIKGTGVSNKKILENLKYALDENKEVTIRIPVIPGFNNTIDDAENFCKLFKTLSVTKVDLLPFHQFGQRKYELLGLEYAMSDEKQLHQEDLAQYKEVFKKHGYIVL